MMLKEYTNSKADISVHLKKMSSLVKVMAWHGLGDKPLTQPMMTHFTDT